VVYLANDVPKGEPREVAERWATQNVAGKAEIEKEAPFAVGGLPAWRLDVAGSSGGASVRSYITFIPFADMVWRLTARRGSKTRTWTRRSSPRAASAR